MEKPDIPEIKKPPLGVPAGDSAFLRRNFDASMLASLADTHSATSAWNDYHNKFSERNVTDATGKKYTVLVKDVGANDAGSAITDAWGVQVVGEGNDVSGFFVGLGGIILHGSEFRMWIGGTPGSGSGGKIMSPDSTKNFIDGGPTGKLVIEMEVDDTSLYFCEPVIARVLWIESPNRRRVSDTVIPDSTYRFRYRVMYEIEEGVGISKMRYNIEGERRGDRILDGDDPMDSPVDNLVFWAVG